MGDIKLVDKDVGAISLFGFCTRGRSICFSTRQRANLGTRQFGGLADSIVALFIHAGVRLGDKTWFS